MDKPRYSKQTRLSDSYSGSSVSIHRNVPSPRAIYADNNKSNHHNTKRHRYNKYIQPVVLLCSLYTAIPAYATDVGGVSATANPVANSSGSVTNQAIQVLQGPYMTNTYGDGISCQIPTMNITPYVTRTGSWMDPYEPYYLDPVYNNADNNDDNIPDNPGQILYHIPTRTGQKSNQNVNLGFSMTMSIPLSKKAQRNCMEAVAIHNDYRRQLTANKRLDFELARLKNCGELIKSGVTFHKKSPYATICADVVVQGVNTIRPHTHSIPPSTEVTQITAPKGDASDLGSFSIGNTPE